MAISRRKPVGRNPALAKRSRLSDQNLRKIVQRVVEVAHPEKIILFGSAARGQMRSDSDVDLLVVKSGAHRRRLASEIYMHLFDVKQSIDVVVVTPEDIERYGHSPSLIIEPALREGRVVYAA
jgi:predicted nucleotidyltransferase